jgi:hypothetical protein
VSREGGRSDEAEHDFEREPISASLQWEAGPRPANNLPYLALNQQMQIPDLSLRSNLMSEYQG